MCGFEWDCETVSKPLRTRFLEFTLFSLQSTASRSRAHRRAARARIDAEGFGTAET